MLPLHKIRGMMFIAVRCLRLPGQLSACVRRDWSQFAWVVTVLLHALLVELPVWHRMIMTVAMKHRLLFLVIVVSDFTGLQSIEAIPSIGNEQSGRMRATAANVRRKNFGHLLTSRRQRVV